MEIVFFFFVTDVSTMFHNLTQIKKQHTKSKIYQSKTANKKYRLHRTG